MEYVLGFLIFVAVIVITAILFGGWLIVSAVRGVSRVLAGPARQSAARIDAPALQSRRCRQPACLAENPPAARFCRRCGHALAAAQNVNVRRVAMW